MTLTIEDLIVAYRDAGTGEERRVLDIARHEVPTGAQCCLVGASGSGKTTLLNVLAGIVQPTSGRVRLGEVEVTSLGEAQRDRFRALHIGYVFQTFNLLQGLTARDNVALAASLAGVSKREARASADKLLDRVGLSHRRNARPGQMSVGEQQRTAIARAIVNRPAVVLADEPTANLDPENGAQVIELLKEVVGEEGSTLFLVTHEPSVMAAFPTVTKLEDLGR